MNYFNYTPEKIASSHAVAEGDTFIGLIASDDYEGMAKGLKNGLTYHPISPERASEAVIGENITQTIFGHRPYAPIDYGTIEL